MFNSIDITSQFENLKIVESGVLLYHGGVIFNT